MNARSDGPRETTCDAPPDGGTPPSAGWSRRALQRIRDLAGAASAPIHLWGCTYVGARARTLGKPRISNQGRIEIRDDVVIDSRFSRTEIVTAPGASIVVGEKTVIEHGVMIVASKRVEIGDGVTIGAYTVLSDRDSPETATGAATDEPQPIWIGDGVTVGARVTVLPGAIVGAGSHILPGSMVAGEIPPGVVAGGNPARPVRKLPSPAHPDAQESAGSAVLDVAPNTGARR